MHATELVDKIETIRMHCTVGSRTIEIKTYLVWILKLRNSWRNTIELQNLMHRIYDKASYVERIILQTFPTRWIKYRLGQLHVRCDHIIFL